MTDNPDNPDTLKRSVEGTLNLFRGDLTDDTLAARLKTLRADPDWRVFVFEGPKVRDVELIYKPTNAWYVLRLTKVRRLHGSVWRRVS